MDRDEHEEHLKAKVMQAAIVETIRAAFKRDNLKLDADMVNAIENILLPPVYSEDPDVQQLFDKEYRDAMSLAMPFVRFIVGETYTTSQQEEMFDSAFANCSWDFYDEDKPIVRDVPIETSLGIFQYDAGCLAIMLENPFCELSQDDHRMLSVFRITVNI
jgi:hypothetical protein